MAAQPPASVPDATGAAVIPQHLVVFTKAVIDSGVAAMDARNGGLPYRAPLQELRRILDTAVASARGTPPVIMEPPSRALYTTDQAAAVMRISARRVRYLAAAGRIRATKSHRDCWLIEADAARDYRRGGTTHADER